MADAEDLRVWQAVLDTRKLDLDQRERDLDERVAKLYDRERAAQMYALEQQAALERRQNELETWANALKAAV